MISEECRGCHRSGDPDSEVMREFAAEMDPQKYVYSMYTCPCCGRVYLMHCEKQKMKDKQKIKQNGND